MALGKRLLALRTQLGFNRSALARRIGVTSQSILQWERDEATPRGKNLAKLAEALQVTEQYMLFGDTTPTPAVANSTMEDRAAFYMSKAFEQDYIHSIESLIAAGEQMGWFGQDCQIKSKVRSLTDFGLLALRANKAK